MKQNCFVLIFALTIGWTRPDASHLSHNQYLPPLQPNSHSYKTTTFNPGNVHTTNQAPLSESGGTSFRAESKNPSYIIHPQIESIRPSIHVASFTIRTEVPLMQSNSKTQQTQQPSSNQLPNQNSYYTSAVSQAPDSRSTSGKNIIPVTHQQHDAPVNVLKQTQSIGIELEQRSSLPSQPNQQTYQAPVENKPFKAPQSVSPQPLIQEQITYLPPAQENPAFVPNNNIPGTRQQNLQHEFYSGSQSKSFVPSPQNTLSQQQSYAATVPNFAHDKTQHNLPVNGLKQTHNTPIGSDPRSSLPSQPNPQTYQAPVENTHLSVPQSVSPQSFIPEQITYSPPRQANRAFIPQAYLPPVQTPQVPPQTFRQQSYMIKEPEKGKNTYTEIINKILSPEIVSQAHSFAATVQNSFQTTVPSQQTHVYPTDHHQHGFQLTVQQNNFPAGQQPPVPQTSIPEGYAPVLPSYDKFSNPLLHQQNYNGQNFRLPQNTNQYLPPAPSPPIPSFQNLTLQPHKTSAPAQLPPKKAQQAYTPTLKSNYMQQPFLSPPSSTAQAASGLVQSQQTHATLTSPHQKYSTPDNGIQRKPQSQQFYHPSSSTTIVNGYNRNVQNSLITTQEKAQIKHKSAVQQISPAKSEAPYHHNHTIIQHTAQLRNPEVLRTLSRLVESISTPLRQPQQISSPLPDANKYKAPTTARIRNNAPAHLPKQQPLFNSHQVSLNKEVPKSVKPTLLSNLQPQSAYSHNRSFGSSQAEAHSGNLLPNNYERQSTQNYVINREITIQPVSNDYNYKPRLTVPEQKIRGVEKSPVPPKTNSLRTYDSNLQSGNHADRTSTTTVQTSQSQNSPTHSKWSSFLPKSEVQQQNDNYYNAQSDVIAIENKPDNINDPSVNIPVSPATLVDRHFPNLASTQPEEKTSLIEDFSATQSPRTSKTEYATSNGYIYYRY